MPSNHLLHSAKSAKKDEFYTRYEDIEREMNAYYEYNKDVFRDKTILCPADDPGKSNFTKYFAARFDDFGIKSLISTSYAHSYLSQFPPEKEKLMSCYDPEKQKKNGRIYRINNPNEIPHNLDEIKWTYLHGDGDFRSEEVTALRDEADIIISNGPFSLFREFLTWIIEGKKQFSIIGNQNAITYKEVFPLIKDNKIWLGNGFPGNVGFFTSPYEDVATSSSHKEGMIRVSGVMWFTNIDLGKRHESLQLMTMDDNLKYNKKLRKKLEKDYGKIGYPHYDNYDAIEVPQSDAIPSDYKPCWFNCKNYEECQYAKEKGLNPAAPALCEIKSSGCMGVPITYLDKHNPEEFEIVKFRKGNDEKDLTYTTCENTILGTERNGTERNGTERNGTERNGTERNGTERNGELRHTSEYSSEGKCNGCMGVPITFLDKFCKEQFEIIGFWNTGYAGDVLGARKCKAMSKGKKIEWNGPTANKKTLYFRVIIRQTM